MIFSALLIGDRSWLWPAVVIVLTVLIAVWWAYRRVGITARVQGAAMALKAAGIVLLATCLVDPLWSGTRARPGANLVLVLADNSASLTVRDTGSELSRGEQIQQVLGDERSAWQTRLAQDFEVRRYVVDAHLQGTDDFDGLTLDGQATSLATSLDVLRRRFQDRPVAGVLLVTDGNATDLTDGRLEASGLPPIYPVIVGTGEGLRDVAIDSVAVSQTTFEDAPVTVQADVSVIGMDGKEITARLIDEGGTVVEQSAQTATDDDAPLSFRFQLRPPESGVSFYRLRVAAEDDPDAESEATAANNARLVVIDRGQGVKRILYVCGRPNWEFKFMNRAIAKDEQIELAALIRIARREPKFDWRSRAGESSNPLFRGFKEEHDEETERYDQPVIVRLGLRNEDELRDGFPKTEEDLFPFAAVILDDVEAEFFNHEQMALLKRFVSERGGGLLMLGGQESFAGGRYRHTAVADMLPVYAGTVESSARPPYRLTLSREGWLEPWARLRNTEADELERFDAMPGFKTLNQVEGVKPGATVIARAADETGRQFPALAAQRYGRGRCAALTVGDLWRWRLARTDESDDHDKAWRQMLRWLVSDVPDRIELAVEPRPDVAPSAVALRVRARGEDFAPLDNADVRLEIVPPGGGEPLRMEAEPSLDEGGAYDVVYVPRAAGAYRVTATVTDESAKELGSKESGWGSEPAVEEFRSLTPNVALLKQLAEDTGGRVVAADELDAFAENLATKDVPITEPWSYPLWHQSWVFLLAVGCFAGEWGLRRWKGLP